MASQTATGDKVAGNGKWEERVEAIARAAYDRCHPGDTFENLKRRSAFSREDLGLLDDWLAYARLQAKQQAGKGGARS
ncbi:hypothetical protein [Mesorhizobium sp. SP-1A]|uniref:hypothetical protein n=1 Tax=Mesorhizobium sp. SP-1A TaxID=3077840 RepID=UPI0028F7154E|nr:hypothetical protein [Mesorhizobium sp. SP-1A]